MFVRFAEQVHGGRLVPYVTFQLSSQKTCLWSIVLNCHSFPLFRLLWSPLGFSVYQFLLILILSLRVCFRLFACLKCAQCEGERCLSKEVFVVATQIINQKVLGCNHVNRKWIYVTDTEK